MKNKNLIAGILLCLPLAIIFVPLMLILASTGINDYLLPILIYIPVSIGLLLSNKWYPEKKHPILKIISFIFLIISLGFMIKVYIFPSSGWNDIGYLFLGVVTLIIGRLFTNIYFALLAGWKVWLKFVAFMLISTLIVFFIYKVILGSPTL